MAGVVVAEGVVVIDADAKGVGDQIAGEVEKGAPAAANAGRSVGRSVFGGIMGSAVVLKGLDIVGEFFGGAISGASDLAETTSKASTIFGDNMGSIVKWADDAEKKIGLSSGAATEAAAGFGNMFSQIGFAGGEAAKMSQDVVQMSADLGSFNNLPTADVADRMSAAFRGEYDSLQALIPNINAARVEQEAMAATGKTNASELTAQEKAAAVLAIVQKDGAAAMGDFAKTADGAANTQKTLTAELEEQQSKLGNTLMPIWQGFLGFLTGTAIPALSTLVTWIQQNTSWLGPLAVGVGAAAVAWGIWTVAMGIHTAYTTAAAAATGGMTFAQWALNAALSANPIGLVIIAVGALVAAIVWVATQTTFFQDVWRNVTSFVGSAAKVMGQVVTNVVNGVGAAFNWVSGVVTGAITWIIGAFASVQRAVKDIFGGIGSFISGVFGSIVGYIKGPINTVIGFLNKAIDGANIVGGAFGVRIGHIPKLANGGTLTAAGTVMVGERGPELLNLPQGASVVPLGGSTKHIGSGEKHFHLTQKVYATDPILGARQSAREAARYLGV
jgi:hypothetical protein